MSSAFKDSSHAEGEEEDVAAALPAFLSAAPLPTAQHSIEVPPLPQVTVDGAVPRALDINLEDEDDLIIRRYQEEKSQDVHAHAYLDRVSASSRKVNVDISHAASDSFGLPSQLREATNITSSTQAEQQGLYSSSFRTPAISTSIRHQQASEQQFKKRFNALKKIYESRIDHLTNSIQKTFNAVNNDEVLMAMSEDETTREFVPK